MKYTATRWKMRGVAAVIALALPTVAMADSAFDSLKQQVEILQKQLDQVQQTLDRYEQQAATKEEVQLVRQDIAEVASLQSEWKSTDSVVHLAGYASTTFSDSDSSDVNAAFTGAQFNPIFHYQYKDLLMLEAELELEVEDDGGTSTELEYVAVDYFLNDYLTVVAGKVLSPLGQFRQNIHPAWINKLPTAPPGFGHDEAAPVSEVGIGARGGFQIGNPMFANYAVYIGNGPILEIDDAEGEIEAIEAEGRTSNDDDRFVFGGRFSLLPMPKLEIGLSGATGKVAGEDEPSARRDYTVYGADIAWKLSNLRLRGEYIKQKVGSEASSAAPDLANWEAWYAQAAYRFLPTGWEGVVRYSDYDSPHRSVDQKQWALGINYLFAPNAMVKFAYNINDGKDGSEADDNFFQAQLAYGF